MTKRIRVLHVAEAAGGVERYLKTLFKYTDHKQVENILVCSQHYNYQEMKKLADQVIVLKMAHEIDPGSDFKVERVLRKVIRVLRPDIVYAHSSKGGAFARIADLGINNKVIYNPHGWAFNMQQSQKKKEMYKWVERISACFCDKIVCISPAEKESALKARICKSSKLQVILNGVDLKAVNEVKPKSRKKLNIPQNAFVIGMVGRLSNQKAPDVFVKAAYLIKKEIPNAYFIMVGDGELRDQIENMIHQYGLDSSFLITGWVNDPIAYMKIINVGMLLSRWEGFGLVLPEYMVCGIPIIATNVDAIPNIIKNDKNGILVKKDATAEIVNAVKNLKNNINLRRSIINNNKTIVQQKYNFRRVALSTFKLYLNQINNNSFSKQ